MSNYRLLLRETPADGGRTAAKAPPPDRQCHTSCSKAESINLSKFVPHFHTVSVDCSHQVDVEAIHGRRATSVQSTVDTNTRLGAMLNILRKLLVLPWCQFRSTQCCTIQIDHYRETLVK